MNGLWIFCCIIALATNFVRCPEALAAPGSVTKLKILALAESGGHHIEFTRAAKPWLKKCGDANGFEVDYITNTAAITEAFLAGYRLVLQIGFCSLRVEA